ncbi:N-acyl-D-amino-acid deacylase family protein [Parahaliea mediterranea]|uniref:Amidohydrolase family protein n=1 Tax=Parahaliea mediterranea TaxID=651086 RepID=A0A939IIC2_9GAMM|nr:amidohydrolase family protein [Parahaliea mediterranea]MBN7795091.1 amidohydrolase family protein [Parahaliea mediterranea]
MDYDLKIINGSVFDGQGNEPIRANVGVKDGVIVEVGPCVGEAAQVIDAADHIVTPGFIDLHTHYDGQVSWDADMQPSINHGVSTVVMGSCGVGFAPVRPGDRDKLIRLMEGVEDIPGTALAEGITWDWETLPEYMDALDAKPHSIDYAVQVTHDPLRVYVMGDRAVFNEPATSADIEAMRRLTREALEAGAIGFSTGRSDVHRSADGEWTPASEASAAELEGIASAFDGLSHGVLQAVNDFNLERVAQDGDRFDEEFDLLEGFASAAGGRPFSLSLMQRDFAPDQWLRIIDRAEKAVDKGLDMRLQTAPRGIGVTVGLQCTFHPFIGFPSYKRICHLPLAERVQHMRDPAFKAQLLGEKSEPVAGDGTPVPPIADALLAAVDFVASKTFRLGENPDYEQTEETSVLQMAKDRGVPTLEMIYDLMLENDGRELLYFPIYNYTEMSYDNVYTMMRHPLSIMGLSDGGAHVGTVCDSSFPTYLLSYWTRDRERGGRLELRDAVRRLTSDIADYCGMRDRGRIKVGLKANINVIDMGRLRLHAPHMEQDLPAGGQRLLQEASGYRAVIVDGEVVLANDRLTGRYPGRLVRVNQLALQSAA